MSTQANADVNAAIQGGIGECNVRIPASAEARVQGKMGLGDIAPDAVEALSWSRQADRQTKAFAKRLDEAYRRADRQDFCAAMLPHLTTIANTAGVARERRRADEQEAACRDVAEQTDQIRRYALRREDPDDDILPQEQQEPDRQHIAQHQEQSGAKVFGYAAELAGSQILSDDRPDRSGQRENNAEGDRLASALGCGWARADPPSNTAAQSAAPVSAAAAVTTLNVEPGKKRSR